MSLDELIPFEQVLEEHLRDPEFRAEWERLAPARAVANRLIGYRLDHGLTQTALGRLLGMSQPAIARLEAGDHVPTIETLVRLADRLGIEIRVDIAPARSSRSQDEPPLNGAVFTERVVTPHGATLTVAIR